MSLIARLNRTTIKFAFNLVLVEFGLIALALQSCTYIFFDGNKSSDLLPGDLAY